MTVRNSNVTSNTSVTQQEVAGQNPSLLYFAFWLTGILVFAGISAVCRLAWPNRLLLSDIVALSIFLCWVELIRRLGIFPLRHIYDSSSQSPLPIAIVNFTAVSVLWVLADIWNHDYHGTRSLVGDLLAGLIFALSMAVFGGASGKYIFRATPE
jgi:hypothetical protein